MARLAAAYVFTLIAFLAIDLVWLGIVARDFYRDAIGDLLQVDLAVAMGFYAVYVTGIVVFAVSPADRQGRLGPAALYGALFGFYCYATYDLTNLATLKDWPLVVALVDIPWGTALTSASAIVGAWATRRVLGPRPPQSASP